MKPPPRCDVTLETSKIDEVPIIHGWTLHHIILLTVGILTCFTFVVSFGLMQLHATHYTKPWEQKHVLRILFMLPVYAASALLIVGFYRQYVYLTIIYQLYEPLAVVSYLTLLLHMTAPTQAQQDEFLETRAGKPWIVPLSWIAACTGGNNGPLRAPRVAKTQFEIIWFCVYQYCVVRVACTVISLITEEAGKYCISSLDIHYAHIWIIIITTISVAIAMHNLIQAHWTVRNLLKHHNVHTKLLCIKLVVFLTFWQGVIFGIVGGKVSSKLNAYISRTDVQIVIQYLLLSVELFVFSLLHLKAYPVSAYYTNAEHPHYLGGTFGWRAWRDCFNLIDVGRSIYRGFHWMFHARAHRSTEVRPTKMIDESPVPRSPQAAHDDVERAYAQEKVPVEVQTGRVSN